MKTFKQFMENLTEGQMNQVLDEAIKMQKDEMHPSERKELLNKLSNALKEQDKIKYSTLRFITDVINRADYLTQDQRQKLLDAIWRGEENE